MNVHSNIKNHELPLKYASIEFMISMVPEKKDRQRALTTLEAVPPGQQPSNINPTEKEGGSPNALLTNSPKAGMIVY